MKTRMTELLGIKYPIMQGGMQHLGVPELAAAVSEAGGLGTINVTIYPDPEDLRKAIKEVKAKTDKPFAVNISLIPSLHPGQELFDQVKVILEEGVTAVETAGASPQELADVLNAHKDQVKWIHKAACVKHAKKAEKTVINVAGDGCFRMNLNELATASRYNIPIVEVVINNHVLGMVRQWQTLFYGGRYSATVLDDKVDFVKVAEGLGCKAIRITKKEEVGPALEEAIAYGGPVVLDCQIDQDDKVFPMVPAGAAIDEVFDEDDLNKNK